MLSALCRSASRYLILSIFFAQALVLQPPDALAGKTQHKVTLTLICDIYEMEAKNGRGGFARIAAALAAERERSPDLIMAHAGDTFSPSLMSGFDQGEHITRLTNMLGLDVFVPGNHEFDFGEDVYRTRIAEIEAPVLAANLRDAQGKVLPGHRDRMIVERQGIRFGIMGLTAENSVQKSRPGSLTFSPSIPAAREQARLLRDEGADIVVAVAHAHAQNDIRLVNSGDIDILLSGDDHDLTIFYNGRSVWAEAKSDGEYVVSVDLDVTLELENGKRKVSWWPNFRIIDTADVEPDAAVAEVVAEYQASLSKALDVEIGKLASEADSRKSVVRSAESSMGNLIVDALREDTGADLALMNGGGIRGDRVYPAGTKLTRRHIFEELPFGNKIMLVELNGADILSILDNAYRMAPRSSGRFAHISGGTVEIDSGALPGNRIISASIGGAPIDPERIYKLATNDFVGSGKEGYEAFLNGTVLLGPLDGRLLVTAVTDYVVRKKTVSPATEGRIIIR